MLKHVTDDTLAQETDQGVVLIDFYADWCGPCRMIAPVLEDLATEFAGRASIVKINVDHAQGSASKFGITSIPTLVVLKNGKEVQRVVGVRDAEFLRGMIEQYI